jgi:hypothetical protein
MGEDRQKMQGRRLKTQKLLLVYRSLINIGMECFSYRGYTSIIQADNNFGPKNDEN